MKKAYLYIALLMGANMLLSSCSDFLDREPITAPNNESFLSRITGTWLYQRFVHRIAFFAKVRYGCAWRG